MRDKLVFLTSKELDGKFITKQSEVTEGEATQHVNMICVTDDNKLVTLPIQGGINAGEDTKPLLDKYNSLQEEFLNLRKEFMAFKQAKLVVEEVDKPNEITKKK